MPAGPASLDLGPGRAAVLGAIQGPTELLPVSSSAHISLIPWLAGWRWHELDSEGRKSFEVALHAGTAVALLIGLRREIAAELVEFDRRRGAVVALSFVPPAIAGLTLERQIESRVGTPAATAAGLIAGAVAMVIADRSPQMRGHGDATARDGLALGLAQAAALVPGVSRNGATLTAARARRFTRDQANLLSRTVALPVIVGAAVLKGERLRRRGVTPGTGRTLAVGAAAAFASTLVSQRLIRVVERDRALWPYAAYRVGLAGAVLAKLRRSSRDTDREVSSENVELVRRLYAELSGGTARQFVEHLTDDVLGEFLDPEVEWVPVSDSLLAVDHYRGFDGTRRFWGEFLSAWQEYRVEPLELHDAGDQVAVVVRIVGRTHELEVDETRSSLLTIRGGRVVRVEAFAEPDGAREAAAGSGPYG